MASLFFMSGILIGLCGGRGRLALVAVFFYREEHHDVAHLAVGRCWFAGFEHQLGAWLKGPAKGPVNVVSRCKVRVGRGARSTRATKCARPNRRARGITRTFPAATVMITIGKPVARGNGPVATGTGARMATAMAGGLGRSIARGTRWTIFLTATGKYYRGLIISTRGVTGTARTGAVTSW